LLDLTNAIECVWREDKIIAKFEEIRNLETSLGVENKFAQDRR
jgi:hypothetical protein